MGTTDSITTIDPITVNVGVIQMDKSKQVKGGVGRGERGGKEEEVGGGIVHLIQNYRD